VALGAAVNSKDEDYYRTRERMERAAAKAAQCHVVRRVHQELALAYSRLIQEGRAHVVSPAICRKD
jgi:hypothetical protein